MYGTSYSPAPGWDGTSAGATLRPGFGGSWSPRRPNPPGPRPRPPSFLRDSRAAFRSFAARWWAAVIGAALRMIQGHIADRHYDAADKALATAEQPDKAKGG